MPPVRHVPTRTGDAQARSQIDIIASSRERRRDACSTARALPLPRGGRAAGQRGPRAGRARSVHPPMLCKLRGTEFRVRAARNLQANTPPCIVSPRSRLLSERTSRSQELQTCRNTFFNVSNDPVNAVTDMPSIYLIRRLPPRSVHSNPSQAWSKTELSLLVYGTSQVDISEARPVTAFGSKNGGCLAKKTLTLSWPRC